MSRAAQTGSRRYKWLVVALTPCLILAGAGGWLVASRSGLEWMVSVAERRSGGNLNAHGISGSLFDTFGMQQLVLRGEGWRITLQDVQLHWQPAALLLGELKVLSVNVRQAELLTLPSDKPPVLPDSLSLPLDLSVSQMDISSFQAMRSEGAKPYLLANDITARFESNDRRHQLQALSARLAYGDFEASGEMSSVKPYALKAHATLDVATLLSGRTQRAHFDAEAGGDLQEFSVKLEGKGAGMSVDGSARLVPFSAMPVGRLHIAFSGVNADLLFDGAPSSLVKGSIDLHGVSGGGLEGKLQAQNGHVAALDKNGLPLLGVTAQIRMSAALWQLQKLDMRLPHGGHISGGISWQQPGGKMSAQLKVRDLDPAALDTRLPEAHLQGDIKLEDVGGDLQASVALSDGTLDLQGNLVQHGNMVELSSVRVARGDTILTGHGQLALDRRRTYRFSSQLRNLDLAKFAAIPQTDLNPIPSTDLNLGLEVSGTLLPEPQGRMQLDLSGSHVDQHDIRGNGQVEFAGKHRATGEVELRLGDNHLNLGLAYGTQADRLQLTLDAPNLDQLGNGLGGRLTGSVDLSGTFAEPRLQFTAQGSDLTLPGRQRIAALDATGDLAQAATKLNLSMTGYRSTGGLTVPQVNIGLQGSGASHTLLASARIAQGDAAISELTLKASGGLSDPAQGWRTLQWQGTIDELAAQGVLPFHLLAAAPLSFSGDTFQLGTADVAIAGGEIRFSETRWTPHRWHSAGRISGINVRAVNLQQYRSVTDAFDPMHFDGDWEATADERLQGRLEVQGKNSDGAEDVDNGSRLGLRDIKLSLRAEQDRLHARLDASGEHLAGAKLQAEVPLTRTATGWTILPDAPLAGHLGLHSDDLSWLGPMLDSNLQSGGRLDFDAKLIGTFLSPRLQGVVQGDALSLALLDQGIRLEQGELSVRFETDAVHIDRLAFLAPYQASPDDQLLGEYTLPAGTGKLSASGRIDMEGGTGDMQVTAERIPLAQRDDRWIIASGTGHARYAGNALRLEGNIRADAGLINQPVSDRPRWSEDVHILGQEPASRSGTPITVNGTLDLGEHFFIRASGLEGRLAGQLSVRDEPDEPLRVTGIIAAQDAAFDAYGQHLQVERGLVNFQGPLDDPGLNILALRKGLSVEAGVEVTGTVRHPVVRLVSTPNVPDGEKLSWIVLGRVPESSGVDSALLAAAAGNILGSQSVGKLGRTFGVDEISLVPQEGEGPLLNQKVTVGKQLTARARISYEQGLTEVGGVTKFIYTLTPRITIVTRTGTEDALDLFYTFRFY